MNAEITELISTISKEKNLAINLVEDMVKESFVYAARKYLNTDKFIDVVINRDTGEIGMTLRVDVVDEVDEDDNYEHEMFLEEAQEFEPSAQIDDTLEVEVSYEEFGRNIILSVKQMIMQKIRDAERKKIFEDYQGRVGDLISGTIQQIDRGTILVNLGRTEALLPVREQIPGERFRQGDPIRAYMLEVADNASGAQVILSRTHPQFLSKLFELEVPEIYDRIVSIHAVARDPGKRAKIAVSSKDERIDPVGACVGMKGNRVQGIVRELGNERIDIVHWHDNREIFIRRTFNPVEIINIHYVGTRKAIIVVDPEDLAMAIGKGGQNIRLASRLVGLQLDIYSTDEFNNFTPEDRDALLTATNEDYEIEEEIIEIEEDGESAPIGPDEEYEIVEVEVDENGQEIVKEEKAAKGDE